MRPARHHGRPRFSCTTRATTYCVETCVWVAPTGTIAADNVRKSDRQSDDAPAANVPPQPYFDARHDPPPVYACYCVPPSVR